MTASATTPGPAQANRRQRKSDAQRTVVAGAASVVALLVSLFIPLLGPLLIALAMGAIAANIRPVSRYVVGSSPRVDKLLLRAGVVFLGLKVPISDIIDLGPEGLTVILVTVAVTFGGTQLAGRLLGLDREMTTLIAAGFSICGASAIAAVEASIRAKPKDVALAIALVTAFGSAMIAVVPALAGLIGLSHEQTAIWAGASIHEVAQVIAAASLIGGGAPVVAIATSVKLARVALLAPVQVLSAKLCATEGERRGPLLPLFVIGFLVAVAVRSTGVLPAWAITFAGGVTTVLLSAAMFGLGTGIVARQLWPVPGRVLGLAGISTLLAAGSSLALVVLML